MTPDFCIITHIYNEPEWLLNRFLSNVRSIYPEKEIIIICDGYPQYFHKPACNAFKCKYILGERLKSVQDGHNWIIRFLNLFKDTNYNYMVQLDPDAMLYHKFKFPKTLEYFGDIAIDKITNKKFIAGFCIGMTRYCCEEILNSNLLNLKDYSNNTYSKSYGTCFRYETTLYDIVSSLNIKSGQWNGITSSTLLGFNHMKYLYCSHQPI